MSASFVVYIDESGDEGFLFEKGSSDWFVVSAVITEKTTDLETVKLIDKVRAVLGRKLDDHHPLHFRDLKHEHRIPFLSQISQANLKAISILIHKPSIVEAEKFQKRNYLYFYASKLLLERVSWYCRSLANAEGNGSAEIIFSNRGGMKYEEFRNYMQTLQAQPSYFNAQIDWQVIKIDQITAFSSKQMGLQIADAVASGFYFGLQPRYGFTEDKYANILKPIMFLHKGRYKGYGIKMWPQESENLLKNESHLNWLKWLSEVYIF